ncbi:MAG: hypothetical protein AB1798_00260 [Spirochaetota bacterium]
MKKGMVIAALCLLLACVSRSDGQAPIGRDDFAVIRLKDGLRIGLLDDVLEDLPTRFTDAG